MRAQFAEKPRSRMYFPFLIMLLFNSSLQVVAVSIGLSSVLFFNVPSSQCKSNSAAMRAARYELTILQLWLPSASSWVRGWDASGVWQCGSVAVCKGGGAARG
jgi:hypothetical protein